MTSTIKLPLLVASLATVLLAGCISPTGNRTGDGAVIGGLAGAAIGGAASDGDLEKAIIGGAIGAGIGAAVAQNTN